MAEELLDDEMEAPPMQLAQNSPLRQSDLRGLDYLRQLERDNALRAAAEARTAALVEKQRVEAALRADREAAQMEASKLLKDGATPQEVTRMLGHRLYGSSPATYERAIRETAPKPPIPTGYVTNLPGMDRPMIAEPRAAGTMYKPVPEPRVVPQPPDVTQRLLEGNADLAVQRREIPKLKAAIEAETDAEKKGVLLDNLRGVVMDMDRQKKALRVASTNYPGYKPASQPQAQDKKSGTLTVSTKSEFDALPKGAVYTGRDGRLYKKP